MWIDPLSDVTKCISCNRRTVLRLITKYENKYQHPSNQWWKLVETNEHMSSAENFHLTLIVEEFGEHVMWIDPLSDVTKCISCNRRTVLSSQKSFMFNRIGYEIITKCSYMWKIFKSISDFQRRCSTSHYTPQSQKEILCICHWDKKVWLFELNVLKEMIEVRAGEKICNCMAMGDVLYIISDILGHWRPIPNYSKCLSLWNTNFLINAKFAHMMKEIVDGTVADSDHKVICHVPGLKFASISVLQQYHNMTHVHYPVVLLQLVSFVNQGLLIVTIDSCAGRKHLLHLREGLSTSHAPRASSTIKVRSENKKKTPTLITKYDNENKYYTEIESSLSRRKFSALLMCSFVSTSFHH
ncbi:hypothetical protein GQR58_030136 [Nymphon striatum]|nr:hypothetical protein GQR58_030136 [Nymphon striatum]